MKNQIRKNYIVTFIVASALTSSAVIIRQVVQAQNTSPRSMEKSGGMTADGVGAKTNNQESSAIFVTEIPRGYRDWRLISVAHEAGSLNDIRAILGNDIAIRAYREEKLPFPDGTIIARIAWQYIPSEENNKLFGRDQSWVAGPPTNGIQFMVKDSKKYAATGGWGFAQFDDGKPASKTVLNACIPCHRPDQARDGIWTRYAP
jgi:Cytochrome P460